MCTKLNEDELRDAVNEFKANARKFHTVAARDLQLPYEEYFFVETVAAEYELLLAEKKVDGVKVINLAVKRILAENPMFSRLKVYGKCKDVFDGNRNGIQFSWANYCKQFFKRLYSDKFEELTNKMLCEVFGYDKKLTTHSADDFAYAVFACTAFACII